MELFKGQILLELVERFKSNEDCLCYLAYVKWSEGYKCLKCGHQASQKRSYSSMVCNKCSHIESATVNTLFHKVKFGVRKAFFICFEMATSTKNLSAKELKKLFDRHISVDTSVSTDLWKGYRSLMKEYNNSQIESGGGLNFKALHTMIHQVKSWIRTTYSWVSEFNINRYLDEFCYRINRPQVKGNIFNNIIQRMVDADKVYQSELICS